MKIHNIKLNSCYVESVYNGDKKFEIRYNDRDYKVGDLLKFIPIKDDVPYYHPILNRAYIITYIIKNYGLKENYIVLSIKPFGYK